VILPGAEDQPVYWALSEFDNIGKARRNLKEREGSASKDIHWVTAEDRAADIPEMVIESVRGWLAARRQFDAVIWTGLTTNWPKKRGQDFTPEDAIRYLKELESEQDRATSTYDRAREYVKNTPSLIQTNVRRAMQQEEWQDTELSKVLFDD